MSEASRPVSQRACAAARTTGMLSAVLVVVLLASGWSEQSDLLAHAVARPSTAGQVAACEARAAIAVRVAERLEQRVTPRLGAADATRERRVPPRTRRVDSWGLPPPRAPTV